MEMTQVYQLANDVTTEILGKSDLLQEDLSNVIDVGKEIFDNTSYDKFCKALVFMKCLWYYLTRLKIGLAQSVCSQFPCVLRTSIKL